MKRSIAFITAFLMLMVMLGVPVFAAGESADVYVTVSDKEGKLALAQEKITVTDKDGDSKITLNDALICAHDAKYTGGAAAGYSYALGQFGYSITKLWGAENGSGYGYYINNASTWSLKDEVKAGARVNAYVYTDTVTWSDTYCYFDVSALSSCKGTSATLTLFAAGYDANFNPIVEPVKDAVITVNGVASSYKTDANGKVTIYLLNEGTHVISATSSSKILVPPVCVLNVGASAPQTGDASVAVTALAVAALAVTVIIAKRRTVYEK